jgi:hypothetical protein
MMAMHDITDLCQVDLLMRTSSHHDIELEQKVQRETMLHEYHQIILLFWEQLGKSSLIGEIALPQIDSSNAPHLPLIINLIA